MMRQFVCAAAIGIAGAAIAATVTVDAPVGTETNVWAFVAGEDALAVNPGATGGTVRLNPNNAHTGGTTLNSGTLVVTHPARAGEPHELGAGPFTQTGGTLRYAGPAGGTWTAPWTNAPAAKADAVVWQIDSDLAMEGDVYQGIGAFVKTGPGTLTFRKPFVLGSDASTSGTSRQNKMDLSPDRAPTKGYGMATITDGKIVIDVDDAVSTNVFGGAADMSTIGGYTTDEPGRETAAEIIHSNGLTCVKGNLAIGYWNGNESNKTAPLSSALRIHGGTFRVGEDGKKGLYHGVGHSYIPGAPILEVAGPDAKLYCNALTHGYTANQHATTIVRDGGLLYCYSSNFPLKFGEHTGNAQTTNTVEVTGAGSTLYAASINVYNGDVVNMRIADGGKIQVHRFAVTKGTMNIVFDGGIWSHTYWSNATAVFPSGLASLKVGPGGMIASLDGTEASQPLIFEEGIRPLDDSGADGGIKITRGARRPHIRFNAANTYCGPTEISQTGVYLGKSGKLPAGTALSIYSNYGGLYITNGIQQVVGSFALGRDTDDTDSPKLGFGPNARLDVTGELKVGRRVSQPEFYLYEKQGGTAARTTAGTYVLVTAREEDFPELVRLSGLATFPSKPDTVDYTCSADISGGRARLFVTVSPVGSTPAASGDPLVLNNTSLDETLAATPAQLAAARTLYTNPSYASNKHGPVDLGALAGFARGGALVSGSGTTYASDLSFAISASDITLGFGTLAYTGGDATIPGFTVSASENRSSVISVTNESTTLTIAGLDVTAGGLTKAGPGTLKLRPPQGTTLTLPSDSSDNGDYNGVTAYGDGPASGTRAVNVVDGWVEIGTAGDPADAPDVFAPADFSVGSQSCRKGIAEQTAGNLRMNNGTLYLNGYLYISYYCGNYASNPDLNLTPTIEQNGGTVSCKVLRMGQCASANQQTASPRLFIHGGTNIVRDAVNAGQSAVNLGHAYRATIDVDGGLMVVSNNFICGNNSKAIGVDTSIRGNGRVEVGDTFYPAYSNTRDTNTFTLAGNGVLRARSISGYNVNRPLVATFDGGTFESLVSATANSQITAMQKAFIGAGGLNIDLSHQTELEGPTAYWLELSQTFARAPDLGDAPDGGITLSGAGTALVYTGFDASTFTAPVRVRDGARFIPAARYAAPFAVEAAATARLHDYQGTCVVKDLALGTAGSSEPVVLELRRDVKGYGFVVTNGLSVLSPVAVTTHSSTHDLAPYPVAGTYTALVYRADNADVDLTLFEYETAAASVSAGQVTVSGGEWDGMKAVVVTIAGKGGSIVANGNTWTSVATGGTWSDAANWANAAAGAPDGATQEAIFNPATASGVAVTLDSPVTLGGLTFNANGKTYGYTLSGSALTLDNGAAGSTIATVVNASGTNTIASAVALASDAELQTTAGNELRVTGGVTGDGDLSVNTHVATGAGQVNLKVSPDYAGKVTTGSGRVVVDDLSFVKSAGQLVIGPNTLHYTGPDVEIPGVTYAAGLRRAAVFENDHDVTLGSLTRSGTSAFMKRGTGTLYLHGTGTFSPNTCSNRNASTGFVSANGDSPRGTTRGFTVATGTFVQGIVDDPENAPTVNVAGNEIAVGSTATQGDATFILNNGTFTGTATLYVGYYSPQTAFSPRATLSFVMNGGTLNTKHLVLGYTSDKYAEQCNTYVEFNGGRASFDSNLVMGRDKVAAKATQFSRFVQNGGEVTFGVNAHLAYKANTAKGGMDLNGGVLTVSNALYAAYESGNDTTLRLNAGATLRCNAVAASHASSTSRLYANGGTFRPLCLTTAAQTMPANAFTYLYASTNGFVVDTSETLDGAPFTMEPAILHDPDCAAADGGLVKRGAGTLTLAGANTYTGGTVVEGGVLALSGAGTLGTGASLAVTDGATCDLGGTAQAVGVVTASGLVRNGALTVTGALLVGESVLSVDGDLALARTAVVDFAGRAGLDLQAGEPVAVVSGAATLPASMKAANAGGVSRVSFVRDGTVIYALKTSGGTTIMIR